MEGVNTMSQTAKAAQPSRSGVKSGLSARRRAYDSGLRGLVWLCAGLTCALLLFLIGYICYRGIPGINWEFLTTEESLLRGTMGILPAIVNTLEMTVIALVIAVPIGICAAIFLVEYTNNTGKVVGIIRITAETLSGIPSIVYGLFGMLFFVTALKLKLSLISGALTLSIMVLPTILRTTEEALLAVPESYREGSFGLGAGRLRTVWKIVLPSALPGIFAGVILAMGRIVGESAALIYTAGTVAKVPDSLFSSTRTLAVHMYALSSEGLYIDQTYATAVVLLLIVVGINALSSRLAKSITKG